jgi:ABC-type branched-subunit amino acid transport system substrate-binding protein
MGQIGRVSATAVAFDAPGRFRPGGPARHALRAAEDRVLSRARDNKFRIALCVPMGGSDGIWGPSCLASARLAEAELNRFDGIAGRACELVPMDASNTAEGIEHRLSELVDDGEVDALVGMHISSVRQRITGAVGGRIPYVYTCLYEGGETTPGVYAIGETSARQLRPSIAWLSERPRPRRWMLVGNDYVWPRVSHRIARQCIAEFGGEVVAETYVPFGMTDYSEVLDLLRKTRCDTVLISIVGQDAVEFNRAFARAGLSGKVLRMSCAIEENQLLAIGAGNTENLHVALGYFAALETDANQSFKERYQGRFGERAPALNSIGQSLYEGMHFLAALLDGTGRQSAHGAAAPLAYSSARDAVQSGGGVNHAPMYLARAEDLSFRVLTRF